MKIKLISVQIFILLSHHFLMAQQPFSKVYDLENDGLIIGQEVHFYDNFLYMVCGKICQNPARQCGDILKLDLEGNIIWRTEIGAFDIGNTNALSISNDTITLTGHRNSMDQPFGFFMQQLTINGDSIRNFTFPIDTSKVSTTFNFGTLSIDEAFYLYGAGRAMDGSVDAIIMQVNKKGEVENTVYWDDGYKEMQPADLQLRTDGSLVLMCEIVDFEGSSFRKRSIIKLDSILNRTYEWSSPMAVNFGVLNNMAALTSNNLVMLGPNTNPGLSHQAPFLHFINFENEEYYTYEFDYQIGTDLQRFTSNIIDAKNGDLLGVGFYWKVNGKRTAFIYRISEEGELLWETTYRSEDWLAGEQFENGLNDIVELDDGSLIAVGWQNETTDNQIMRDVLMLRVGPDGCLHEENCDFGQFTTSVKESDSEKSPKDVLFYPNPNLGSLYLSEDVIPNSILELYSNSGEKLICFNSIKPNTIINIDGLDSGMYLLKFISPQNNNQFRKMIIR